MKNCDIAANFPDEVICYYPAGRISALEVCTELFEKTWPHAVYHRVLSAGETERARALKAVDEIEKAFWYAKEADAFSGYGVKLINISISCIRAALSGENK